MQLNSFAALAILAFGHFFLEVAANSGYAATCNSIEVYPPVKNAPHYSLCGNCEKDNGVYIVGICIDLGSCFGNSGGKLVAQLK